MTDAVIGIFCAALGVGLAIVGIAILAFGCYTLVISYGGGWWIVELFYVLLGAGVAFIGLFSSRYGLRLLREKKNPMVRDGTAT